MAIDNQGNPISETNSRGSVEKAVELIVANKTKIQAIGIIALILTVPVVGVLAAVFKLSDHFDNLDSNKKLSSKTPEPTTLETPASTSAMGALPNGALSSPNGTGSPTSSNDGSQTPGKKGPFTEYVNGTPIKFEVSDDVNGPIEALRHYPENNTTVVEPTQTQVPEGNDPKKYAEALTADVTTSEDGLHYATFPGARHAANSYLSGVFWDKDAYAKAHDPVTKIYDEFNHGTKVKSYVEVDQFVPHNLRCQVYKGNIVSCESTSHVVRSGDPVRVAHFPAYKGVVDGETFTDRTIEAVEILPQLLKDRGIVELSLFTDRDGKIMGANERLVARVAKPDLASPSETTPQSGCGGGSLGSGSSSNPNAYSPNAVPSASNGSDSGAHVRGEFEDGVILHRLSDINNPGDNAVIGVSIPGTVKPNDVFGINDRDFSLIDNESYKVGCFRSGNGFWCNSVPENNTESTPMHFQELPILTSGPGALDVTIMNIANSNAPPNFSPDYLGDKEAKCTYHVEAQAASFEKPSTGEIGTTDRVILPYSPPSNASTFSANGGNEAIRVIAPMNCQWKIAEKNTGHAPWIDLLGSDVSSAHNAGNTVINLRIPANPSSSGREETLTVAGEDISIYQEGAKHPQDGVQQIKAPAPSIS